MREPGTTTERWQSCPRHPLLAWLMACAVGFSAPAGAVVVRHDAAPTEHATLAAHSLFDATGFLQFAGGGVCTGTLVAAGTILTAAHCVAGKAVDEVSFGLGEQIAGAAVYGVAGIVSNSLWISGNPQARHDTALVFLEDNVTGITPAAIDAREPQGRSGAFAGYGVQGTGQAPDGGLTGTGDKLAARNVIDFLIQGQLFTDFDAPDDADKSLFGSATPLPLEGSGNNGDSGMPLFAQFEDEWRLVGIYSTTGNPAGGDGSAYGAQARWVWLGSDSSGDFLEANGVAIAPVPLPAMALPFGLAAAGLLVASGRRRVNSTKP